MTATAIRSTSPPKAASADLADEVQVAVSIGLRTLLAWVMHLIGICANWCPQSFSKNWLKSATTHQSNPDMGPCHPLTNRCWQCFCATMTFWRFLCRHTTRWARAPPSSTTAHWSTTTNVMLFSDWATDNLISEWSHAFPKNWPLNSLYLDLLNNLGELAEDRDAVLSQARNKVTSFNRPRLQAALGN